MKTILVPTDFSSVAKNAAHYAIELAKQVNAEKIILYNAYQAPVVTEPTMPVVQMIDIDTLRSISNESLQHFKESVQQECPPEIELDVLSEFAVLSNVIDDVVERTSADIIVMGITGGSKVEEVLIGSTAISVVKHSTIPVVVIPPNARFSTIEHIVLACDYKKVVETTPIGPIRNLLKETGAKLTVLHVDPKHKHESERASIERAKLDSLLEGFTPEYVFIDNEDFVEGINEYADSNGVDLIITIPKKHGLFEGLFKRSHTKQLAFHSHVPLMCIHED